MEKKKHFPVFWVCFALFVLLMAIFWIWVISYVKKCLVTYEDSQPERIIEQLAAKMEDGTILDFVTIEKGASRFEEEDIYLQDYLSRINGKAVTYEKEAGSYDAKRPVYLLYAGDEPAARVTLAETASESLMFILTAQQWEVVSVEPVYNTGTEAVTIVVPDTYNAFINNIKADDRELTGNQWELAGFQYAAEYVTVPKLVEYHVEDLFEKPEVKIYNNYGEETAYTVDPEGTIRIEGFDATAMPKELESYVLSNAKDYSNFFSRDIEGCRNSVAPIAGMFPEDSYYLELAENYRLNDMWMYSAHETPVFSEERVSNYIVYTPELFSVEVYFEKSMKLTSTGDVRTDITNTRYYYANIGGSWLIVDMQSVLEQ